MKKFENIVIASDLDGTFFGKGARIIDRNLHAVKYFTNNGGHFAVASGRTPAHILFAFPEIGQYVNMPCVTCNGAVIADFSDNSKHVVKKMDRELVLEFNEFLRSISSVAAVRFCSKEIDYIYTPEDALSEFYSKEIENIKAKEFDSEYVISEPETWGDLCIYQAVVKSDRDDIERIREALKERFHGRLYITQSGRSLLDIQCDGVTKGNTLRQIVSSNLGKKTIYTCGDYLNDLGLHASGDVSVCPANAHEEIKAICSLCLCSNEDGVIADLVEYLDKELEK